MPKKYLCPYCKEKGEEREITKAGMRMHVATKHPEKMDEWMKSRNAGTAAAEEIEKGKEGGGQKPSEEGGSFQFPETII